MSKFNQKRTGTKKTTNHEGAGAYKMSPELELYSAVVTSTLDGKFYESGTDRLKRIQELMKKCDDTFVAKLAVYTREEMYLRTLPLVLTVELAKNHSGDDLISRLSERVIQRADEITEMLAYYQLANKRAGTKKLAKLSNQLKKGIGKAFYKFDEYQFSKYNKDGAEIKLRDALFLTHAKPRTEEEAALFKRIADNTLETPKTWETAMSKGGQSGESKQKTWEEMIMSRKMGYMATLRNLNNFVKNGVSPEAIAQVCDYLRNPNAVANSKQLPFRFLSAYRMLTAEDPTQAARARRYGATFASNNDDHMSNPIVGEILDALEDAVKLSSANLPFNEKDRVCVAADVSGSMFDPISQKSVVRQYDIGLLMAMTLQHKCRFVTSGFFGNSWKTVNLPKSNILQNVSELYSREGEVGYATNGYKVLEWANKLADRDPNRVYDKFMFFTDEQMYGGRGRFYRTSDNRSEMQKQWTAYKKKNPNAKLYLFDLAGYGTSPLSLDNNDVYHISGWSDKVWDILSAIEDGSDALKEINKIQL